MKNSIVKGIALCTLALSLLFVGASVINTANAGVAVCHDGPHNEAVVK